jgi:hypothetical protein
MGFLSLLPFRRGGALFHGIREVVKDTTGNLCDAHAAAGSFVVKGLELSRGQGKGLLV